MMMMKAMACCGAPLPFCFFLRLLFVAAFQTSDAVQCISANDTFHDEILVECPVCAYFECFGVDDEYYWGIGCPSDFYNDCSSNSTWSTAIQFVKTKTKLCYWDTAVRYVSCDTPECLEKKVPECKIYTYDLSLERNVTLEDPAWYCEKPGDNDCPVPLENSGDAPNSGNSNGAIGMMAAFIGLLLTQIL